MILAGEAMNEGKLSHVPSSKTRGDISICCKSNVLTCPLRTTESLCHSWITSNNGITPGCMVLVRLTKRPVRAVFLKVSQSAMANSTDMNARYMTSNIFRGQLGAAMSDCDVQGGLI